MPNNYGGFRTAFSESIFRHKYAQGPNDTWHNLAIRLVDDVCGTRGGKLSPLMSKEDRAYLVELIRTFKFIPGGRYLYYAGRDAHFWNNCGNKNTLLLTDSGYQKMGEFEDGESLKVYSPVSGEFEEATMHTHGIQPMQRITLVLPHNSNHTKEVIFTPDHKWPTRNRGAVEDLRVGDIINFSNISIDEDEIGLIHGMVFADGNVHKRKKKKDFAHQLRLCGDKAKYVDLFSEYTVTYPEFANGDPLIYIPSSINFKELPDNDMPLEYIVGFLKGWLLFDGHDFGNGSYQLHTVSEEAIDYFITNSSLLGLIQNGNKLVQTNDSNFGARKPLFSVRVRQADKIYATVNKIQKVEDAVAYCPFEPKHNRIVVDGGIDTYQCYLLKAEEDSREEWAALTSRAMSALMSGGGIGIDYSILRGAGRTLSRTGGRASGPIPLMYAINEVGRNVMQGGSRRSAMYASLNWKHPDIKFPDDSSIPGFLYVKDWAKMPIGKQTKQDNTPFTLWDAKQEDFNFPAPLDMTNISVNYDNSWLEETFGLPAEAVKKAYQLGDTLTPKTLPDVYLENVKEALRTAEPGFSFNFWEKENETLRNACTEVSSEDDSDVCNLGSINLGAVETLEEFQDITAIASKFLVCGTIRATLPYEKVYKVREKNRRLGLGLMGIHEWLLKRGEKYEVSEDLHKWLAAYASVSESAANEHCDRFFISRPAAYRAIAPTGSIGILAATTTGIEPLIAVAYKRRYLKDKTRWHYQYVVDSTADTLIQELGISPETVDTALGMADNFEQRIKFQADVQDYVDMSISSTINLPEWGSKFNNENMVVDFATTLARYAPRLRGFTCYPDGARGGQPLTSVPYEDAVKHKGVEFQEHDICQISGKGGVCGA